MTSIPEPFRSQLSYDIFNNKYKHEGAETWAELCATLVNEVVKDRMPKDERDTLIQFMSDMKFIPGGRYLYYAGRPNKYYNNCLSRDTKVLTDKGWRLISDLGTANVLSPVDGKYYPAEFLSRGVQQLQEITFSSVRGRSTKQWKVKATRSHHWPLIDGSDTFDLRIGDIVPANSHDAGWNQLGFLHGFIFGDGNKNGQARLCGEKKKYLSAFSNLVSVTYPKSADGDPVIYCNSNVSWKELPKTNDSSYLGSFIKGWLAADGSDTVLSSINKEHLVWFEENCALAGYIVSGNIRSQVRNITLGKYEYNKHQIHFVSYIKGDEWQGFKVVDIQNLQSEEVFCPFEPIHNRIIIDSGIDTYQCYLLKAEEDTKEDWADLAWRVTRCLMTGGGIGVDYSVYRAEGTPIKGAGGWATGPIATMKMINEIGRNVMQGGSRRSAIYGSLNWQHGDIEKFLKVKDWNDQPLGKTGMTYGEARAKDPTLPCDLDMTNISVNYDTKWVETYKSTGDVGATFLTNVRKAVTTGEPGFSFNFYDKENETLRNACCEVTSSDDSDVCNLGSLNLSRISTLEEFKHVVELATKFLLCGTLEAKLPYDKVAKVREKNRRLGLGFMGVHEWLIQRGSKYDVTPELHSWLAIYRDVSNDTSSKFASSLGVSRPVANRSIAPTGTIGLIAGTTSGIEPIYSVAYKRRYLNNNNRWVSTYGVDFMAQEMIERYGIDPDTIETASDLANDYERRIKFQADVQDYVDMAISSTINLPGAPADGHSDDYVSKFANTLASYAPRLRGFTCYPDGARGGQPLTAVGYDEAKSKLGQTFEEHVEFHDACDIRGGGFCGT